MPSFTFNVREAVFLNDDVTFNRMFILKRHDIIILKPEVTAKKVFGETEVKKEIVTKVETFQKFDK